MKKSFVEKENQQKKEWENMKWEGVLKIWYEAKEKKENNEREDKGEDNETRGVDEVSSLPQSTTEGSPGWG